MLSPHNHPMGQQVEGGIWSSAITPQRYYVRGAATANIADLTAVSTTQDEIVFEPGERIFLPFQTNGIDDGVYVWQRIDGVTGLLIRARDWELGDPICPGTEIYVGEGATYGDEAFVVKGNVPVIVGTTDPQVQLKPNFSPSTVIWAPSASPGEGYYVEWADVVAAVQRANAPTTIQIEADINDDVVIPGGTWALNDTTIVGKVAGADTDTDFRGYQDLLYVTCSEDETNPTWLQGVVGLKDMFFRAFDNPIDMSGSDLTIVSVDGSTVTAQKGIGVGAPFKAQDVGKPIRVGDVEPYGGDAAAVGDNNGTFIIASVIDEDTITFENSGSPDATDANNGSISWDKAASPFIVLDNEAGTFTLTNVDFRYGGNEDWGSIFVGSDANLFIREHDTASIRWFSCIVDGYLVIQSDGSACWVGSLAFSGAGFVDVFPMGGTEVHTFQEAIFDWALHQPTTVYLPGNTGDWNGSPPTTMHEALDRLAAVATNP